MAKLYDEQFRHKQLNAPVDYRLGDDVEVKLAETIAMMLEQIAKRIRTKAMDPPKTIILSTETEYYSTMLLADLEYWDEN